MSKGASLLLLAGSASVVAAASVAIAARRAQLESKGQQARCRALESLQVTLVPATHRWKRQRSARSIQSAWRRNRSKRRDVGVSSRNDEDRIQPDHPVGCPVQSSWRARLLWALLDDSEKMNSPGAECLVDTPGSSNSSFSLDEDEASDVSDDISEHSVILEGKVPSTFHSEHKHVPIRNIIFGVVAFLACASAQMDVSTLGGFRALSSVPLLSQRAISMQDTRNEEKTTMPSRGTTDARRSHLLDAMLTSLE